MSKKSVDPKDDYGPPIKDQKDKEIILGSPSFISKVTSPITATPLATIKPTLLTPLAFTSQITSPLSIQKNHPSTLAYYTPPSSLPKSTFITKDLSIPILPLETLYCPPNSSLLQNISRIFPPGFYFIPKDQTKTRKFYEFILVDSESITLTHQTDPSDKSKIKFSKFKVNKVLSPSDWNQPPSELKSFSRAFTPQYYSYFDYMDAWFNFLSVEPFNHTWFIWFNKDISLSFPNWFIQWFIIVGPILEIFPDYASKAFNNFTTKTTWSSSTQLVKKFSVKWWSKFNPDLLSPSRLDSWFKSHSGLCKEKAISPEDTSFLLDKSKLLASLSATSSHKEFLNRIKEAMTALSESDSASSTSENNNEDDCYGIIDL
ncbi:hypothetical protein KIW84_065336 [Lathyrus oleraceus]|uniref:Uncharacterized protein n=1 Tax=Pisum sativum TaxID=3888 RepID=A0A9D5A9L4_PEA|nr:hypothetical protein KIW84_065336 [Pisum sativum]